MIKIPKKIIHPHFTDKAYMLIGTKKDNTKIYMEQASYDCNWYYGFGYLEAINHNHTDINEHYHFNSLFEKFGIDKFKEEFKETTLTENELWILFDLMKTFYTLKDTAELYYLGNSHYTSDTTLNLKNETKYREAMKDQCNTILQVQKLLGLPNKENTIIKGR